jgi:CHRD domain
MKKVSVMASLVLILAAVSLGFTQGFKNIKELLIGYEEVPAVSTTGNGEFQARISNDESEIAYTLSYNALEGSVTQAHIHLGQPGVNGGISVWLCANPERLPSTAVIPPNTQRCPDPPATITGRITANDVVGPTAQGITAGELAELIRAIRAGATYVNVHSTKWTGGEIRSQIDHEGGHKH